jgi:hypothetical protein
MIATFTSRASIATCALLAAVAASSARANDAADLQARVRAALHDAKSFTLTLEPGMAAVEGAGTIDYVVVEPGRYHQIFKPSSGTVVDTIVIDATIYDRLGAGAFHSAPFAKERQTPFLGPLFDVRIVSRGPDVIEDGRTRGTYVATDPLAGDATATVTCSYDKSSARPVACHGAQTRESYARYDDPTLAVDVPPGAKPYP